MPQVPYSDLSQQQLETVLKLAQLGLTGAERALKVQFETAKEALEQSAKSCSKLGDAGDVQEAMAVRNELLEVAMGSALGLSRSLYELASQTQLEFAKLLEEKSGGYQKSLLNGLETLGSNSPLGNDFTASLFKSSTAASQAAFDNLNKAAKQIAEFADASVKAATTTTAEAVKRSTAKV